MLGLMQSSQLLVSKFMNHAALNHGTTDVISMLPEGGQLRTNYAEINRRSKKLTQALTSLGITFGDCVATLAWNSHRHLEAWFGTIGMGAVTHTVNPRLFPEQLIHIINHAEDRILLFDISFLDLVEKIAPNLSTIEHYVIMVGRDHMPESSPLNPLCYEELIAKENGDLIWPEFDENTACSLCYTSGTTGNPKGVLYSHRSNYLHTLTTMSKDGVGVGSCETLLQVVPMFHVNAWGVPYAAVACGAKLVLNGPHNDVETLHDLIIKEEATITGGVPTVWSNMLAYLEEKDLNLGTLKTVIIGGSAVPRSMIEKFKDRYGVWVTHLWGMTEMSPLGTLSIPNARSKNLTGSAMIDMQTSQGRGVFGFEMCTMAEDKTILPRDGKSAGRLMVRGPWVVQSYFKQEDINILEKDQWFDTGDMATIDADGYMRITDRSKDIIKSGGEWISSIDLENAAVSHPDVHEAAVIGIYHPVWEERPLMVVVPVDGKTINHASLIEHLTPLVAKWWLPDAMEIVKAIPHTATGKISKLRLREMFKDFKYTGDE